MYAENYVSLFYTSVVDAHNTCMITANIVWGVIGSNFFHTQV